MVCMHSQRFTVVTLVSVVGNEAELLLGEFEMFGKGTGTVWKVLVRYANYFVKGKRRDVFVY